MLDVATSWLQGRNAAAVESQETRIYADPLKRTTCGFSAATELQGNRSGGSGPYHLWPTVSYTLPYRAREHATPKIEARHPSTSRPTAQFSLLCSRLGRLKALIHRCDVLAILLQLSRKSSASVDQHLQVSCDSTAKGVATLQSACGNI